MEHTPTVEIPCCLCQELCYPGDDLRTHLLSSHQLGKTELQRCIKTSTEQLENNVNSKNDNPSHSSTDKDVIDEGETEEFLAFATSKFECYVKSIFKNLDGILQGEQQMDPTTFDSTNEVTMDDIKESFASLREIVSKIEISDKIHQDLKNEFKNEKNKMRELTQPIVVPTPLDKESKCRQISKYFCPISPCLFFLTKTPDLTKTIMLTKAAKHLIKIHKITADQFTTEKGKYTFVQIKEEIPADE